jgi:acetate kinase
LYRGEELLASLHFEFADGKVICNLRNAADEKTPVAVEAEDLGGVVGLIHQILVDGGYLKSDEEFDAIVIRIAAPGDYFTADHVVDAEFFEQLEVAKKDAPLHAPVTAAEIEHLSKAFAGTKLVAVSDSEFHASKPKLTKYYAFDTDLADKHGIKRFGYHGLSVASIVRYMKEQNILADKMIVCHIGSGSSVTAVLNGTSLDNSMGFSPLEGLMMSTRAGSMDVAAALRIKQYLDLDDDGVEKYLNKQAGLLGVTGFTDDMRLAVEARDKKQDERATFAIDLYVHRIQCVIGQRAAELGGVDAIVFSGTVGERGYEIREPVMSKLGFLGFELDAGKNNSIYLESGHDNIATEGDSKPIYVVKTDEARQMVFAANQLLNSL